VTAVLAMGGLTYGAIQAGAQGFTAVPGRRTSLLLAAGVALAAAGIGLLMKRPRNLQADSAVAVSPAGGRLAGHRRSAPCLCACGTHESSRPATGQMQSTDSSR
jgi:hypothetical protein